MKCPGAAAKHCIITDNCRKAQGGDEQAIDEALRRIRRSMRECLEGWEIDRGVKLHLMLTVDRSEVSK